MENNPLLLALFIGVSLYVIKLWFDDLKLARAGTPNPRALPGAVPTTRAAIIIAALGGVVIVALETLGENALGISEEQSKITVLFAAYTLLAAFVEEVIFRGYIVVENKGTAVKWAAVFAASLLFAAFHPFLWHYEEGVLTWHFDTKGWFSFSAVFIASLWFYFVRFASFNPTHSLAPCFAAHFAKNAGVIVVKAFQGHIAGLY